MTGDWNLNDKLMRMKKETDRSVKYGPKSAVNVKKASRKKNIVDSGKGVQKGEAVDTRRANYKSNTEAAAPIWALMNNVKKMKDSGKLTKEQFEKARDSAKKRDNERAKGLASDIYAENFLGPEAYDNYMYRKYGTRRNKR